MGKLAKEVLEVLENVDEETFFHRGLLNDRYVASIATIIHEHGLVKLLLAINYELESIASIDPDMGRPYIKAKDIILKIISQIRLLGV